MQIKKPFQAIVDLLQANPNAKVQDILQEVIDLSASKQATKTVRRDAEGNITHIFCWYHKMWEPLELFGAKSSHYTGYNPMCKVGVNQWTKQQRLAKAESAEILTKVATGIIAPEDIQAEQAKIEARRNEIHPRPDGIGESEE